MRLDKVTIGRYKNLRDLFIDFDEGSPYTVLVGENGAGKSNLIEAIALIFQHLDLDQKSPFDYQIKYQVRGQDVDIQSKAESFPTFCVRERGAEEYGEIPRRRFMVEDELGPLYRPAFVFGYYSGPSDRLSAVFQRHRERYYDQIIASGSRRKDIKDPNILRRLFYAETLHGQFALIAFFMRTGEDGEADRAFLREHLQIEGLESVLFALRRPPWRRAGGDPRFWNAVGEVQQFLDHLYREALLPARMMRRIPVDLTKNPEIENLYLFLPDAAALERVFDFYGDQYSFFTALESTHLSKLLAEVRTRVRMTAAAGGGAVTYRDLSEGEQQLLLVLGLLKFTARDEALFLLDEPDTHLNPAWATQYLDFLDRFIRGRSSCHIVMTTHDPLVFSRLESPQVQIFRRGETGEAEAEPPVNDPKGMGIQAILASDLFRLPSAGLDPETRRDLNLQRQLVAKTGDLTPDEETELRRVTERLNARGFWKSDPDPVFQLFLQKFLPRWVQREKIEWIEAVELTPAQAREREALADEIAAEVEAELAAEKSAAS